MLTWDSWFLEREEVFRHFKKIVRAEYDESVIYPENEDLFLPYSLCSLEDVKVVMLGKKPSPFPHEAHGLAFSCFHGVNAQVSNLFKKVNDELGVQCFNDGNLTRWAEQGVLMLNEIPIVPAFIKGDLKQEYRELKVLAVEVIRYLIENRSQLVFLDLGTGNSDLREYTGDNHLIIQGYDPLFRSFFIRDYFKPSNDFLHEHGKERIDWR